MIKKILIVIFLFLSTSSYANEQEELFEKVEKTMKRPKTKVKKFKKKIKLPS